MITKVQASPNFKKIYYKPEQMTFSQKYVTNKIISKLKMYDFSNQKGRTYEEYYERLGLDFIIHPDNNSKSVSLNARDNNIDQEIHIGTYNVDYDFDIIDIENKFRKNKAFDAALSTLLIILASIFLFLGFKYNKKPEQLPNNITIVKDSIQNNAKQAIKDSINIIKQ